MASGQAVEKPMPRAPTTATSTADGTPLSIDRMRGDPACIKNLHSKAAKHLQPHPEERPSGRVSKDGSESLPCIHPSRRAQKRAPQDEVRIVSHALTSGGDFGRWWWARSPIPTPVRTGSGSKDFRAADRPAVSQPLVGDLPGTCPHLMLAAGRGQGGG